MNFDRETWRPLFVREPLERRMWTIMARGLRAYLLQVAEDDGTLIKGCADPLELATLLFAQQGELELVQSAISALLRDGFLRWTGTAANPGWLGVDRLVSFASPPSDAIPWVPVEGADQWAAEGAEDRRRRLARGRKQRSRRAKQRDTERDQRDIERDQQRDIGSVTSVTSVTEERDQRDLPPQSPPSERDKHTERERESGARARDMSHVTSVTGERDMSRSGSVTAGHAAPPAAGWTRSLPSPTPPAEYLAHALSAGVRSDQATSTWKHYYAAGLPHGGVERIFEWLTEQAIEYGKRPARLARGPQSPPWQPNGKAREFAEQHGKDLDALLPSYRRERRPEEMSRETADTDFERRLACFVATGKWIPTGPLPKRQAPQEATGT